MHARTTLIATLAAVSVAMILDLARNGLPVPRTAASPIEIWDETQVQACDAGLDYERLVRRASRGDADALLALIEFSPRSDAAGALGHGCVLVGLLDRVGDANFARCAARATPPARRSLNRILEYGIACGRPQEAPLSPAAYYPLTAITADLR